MTTNDWLGHTEKLSGWGNILERKTGGWMGGDLLVFFCALTHGHPFIAHAAN